VLSRTPLVSIVTPSFNQAEFLEAAMRSVLAQDYPAIEYLVVDGGSSDGSVEIIRSRSGRITWWASEPDEGQAEAINKGLARARGEVVAWLNSDDLYLPGAVSQAVAALNAAPEAGLVFGDAITIDEKGRPLNTLRFGNWGLQELMGFRIICQPAVFMRRRTLEQSGLLDPAYHFMLDHHLWLRIARRAPVQHVPALWAAARHHSGAKNVSQATGFGRETYRILDWMQSQPDFAPLVARHQRQVLGGAHRLNGRYLLDAGLPREALQAYGKALLARPAFALRHWHRILYAALSLVGGGRLAGPLSRLQSARGRRAREELVCLPGLAGWPGLAEENHPASG
jgi:glycosyltransferase involved in cell wall biosynthesis